VSLLCAVFYICGDHVIV